MRRKPTRLIPLTVTVELLISLVKSTRALGDVLRSKFRSYRSIVLDVWESVTSSPAIELFTQTNSPKLKLLPVGNCLLEGDIRSFRIQLIYAIRFEL